MKLYRSLVMIGVTITFLTGLALAQGSKKESQLRTVRGVVSDKEEKALQNSVVFLKNLRTNTVLSQGRRWHESNTDESSECDERSKKTKSAHNLYLPLSVGAPICKSDSSPVQRVARTRQNSDPMDAKQVPMSRGWRQFQ